MTGGVLTIGRMIMTTSSRDDAVTGCAPGCSGGRTSCEALAPGAGGVRPSVPYALSGLSSREWRHVERVEPAVGRRVRTVTRTSPSPAVRRALLRLRRRNQADRSALSDFGSPSLHCQPSTSPESPCELGRSPTPRQRHACYEIQWRRGAKAQADLRMSGCRRLVRGVFVHGGVQIYRGSAKAARHYVEADRSRADDYYLAEGTGLAARFVATSDGVREVAPMDGPAYEWWVAGHDVETGRAKGAYARTTRRSGSPRSR